MKANRAFVREESGASEVLGTVLLIGITIGIMGGLTVLVLNIKPPIDVLHADLSMTAGRGLDGAWGTADEVLTIQHLGGEPIERDQLTIIIDQDGAITALGGPSLSDGFSDGQLTIGELWRHTTLINENSKINVDMVLTGTTSSQLIATQVVSVADACNVDVAAPYPATWTQSPADLSATHNGSVTVGIVATDTCSNVDQNATMSLQYRINDGSAPSFTSVTMSRTAASTWQGIIPDQAWASRAGQILEYRVSGLADEQGNVGSTNLRSDIIQLVGIDTMVFSFNTTHGSVANFANMRNQNDGGLTGRIDEAPADPPIPYYSNDGQGRGSGSRTNLEGAPNNAYFTISKVNDEARSGRQDIFGAAGTILKVEAVFESHYTGIRVDDFVDFEVKPRGGTWIKVVNNVIPGAGTDSQVRVDVTSLDLSGTWDWTDIRDSEIKVSYDQYSTEDLMQVHVDSMWFEVTTDGSVPKSRVDFSFEPLPVATTHILDIHYRAAGNDFTLEVWDGSAWNVRGPILDSPVMTSATYPLTTAEALANSGSPLIRISSINVPTSPPDRIFFDYIKVTSA